MKIIILNKSDQGALLWAVRKQLDSDEIRRLPILRERLHRLKGRMS